MQFYSVDRDGGWLDGGRDGLKKCRVADRAKSQSEIGRRLSDDAGLTPIIRRLERKRGTASGVEERGGGVGREGWIDRRMILKRLAEKFGTEAAAVWCSLRSLIGRKQLKMFNRT